MWEQTLSGLIKALRASKDNESSVIKQSLAEISQEVRSTELELKAGAVLKLCYLDMLGYPQLSAYSFNVIECMSSNKIQFKLIGYLAANQSFGPSTEVSMLTTNLLKKDLVSQPTRSVFNSSSNPPSILSTTLASLPHLLTSQNYVDLTPDILSILNHSKPAIRKRAIIVIHTLAKLDLQRALDEEQLSLGKRHSELDRRMAVWVDRLREKLLDEDLSVVNSAVNVVCELALTYPWPWLELAAELYDLLKLGSNNWMMIKIVKLFTALTPIEPRLTRKLLPALTELISTTNAMSLLYECIHTILAGGLLTNADAHELASTITDKLAGFLSDPDQNLRYIALVGLHKLLGSAPNALEGHLHTILCLVTDPDPSLSSRALALVEGIRYHPSTLQETIDFLLAHIYGRHPELSDSESEEPSAAIRSLVQATTGTRSPNLVSLSQLAAHRRQVAEIVISIGCRDTYAQITDFEAFLDTLLALAPFLDSPKLLSDTLIDLVSRVPGLRPYAVQTLSKVDHTSPALRAGIWICGEYSTGLEIGNFLEVSTLEPHLTSLALHNALKRLSRALKHILLNQDSSEHNTTEAIKLVEQLAKQTQTVIDASTGKEGMDVCVMVERARELGVLLSYILHNLQSSPPRLPSRPLPPPPQRTSFYEAPNPFASQAAQEREEEEEELPIWYTTLQSLFSAFELRPVAPLAQSMVVPPDELELESWRTYLIAPRRPEGEDDGRKGLRDEFGRLVEETEKPKKKKVKKKAGERRGATQQEVDEEEEIDLDAIPIVKLDLSDVGLDSEVEKQRQKKKGKKKKDEPGVLLRRKPDGGGTAPELSVDRVGEMPDLSYLGRRPSPAVPAVELDSTVLVKPDVPLQADQQETAGAGMKEVVKVVVKKKKRKVKVKRDEAGSGS
ncbi:hypothetical protein CROQUDRAFT_668202 [Cronartium quercuum f. sp. fusiforme G11]|uniref:Clathrin/coatomer adaptor adaptin-like N-terminal domain-containing protein n=1 Tax=Cronartium quercuum f. sp. fusiforme G11 TaxID=708437 RepID=A0A9P6NPC5_9BASI|nr:hypothetical protein CROQUDRAFT_668202 [Cronartium quercuum f. sp. fusiforme G11]